MSNAVERTADGWCVKVTKSTAKKKNIITHQSSNNPNQSYYRYPDIFKKFENYIMKAHKFQDPEHLLYDLEELRDIAVKLYSSSNLLEWTTK
jgi:hypothetical protein